MYIERLKLKNFRNYEDIEIDFSKNYNIIYGENAQGKTNIIEAIFLCASGRSHRTSKDIELVNINSVSYYVNLNVCKEAFTSNIEILYERDKKKVIKVNEIPLKKIVSLMGNLLAVVFSPEDILIINEGPSQRRRFIDITISQIKPSYFYDLQVYNRILQQRNSLLKEIQNNRRLINTLDIWDEKLSETGSRIIKTRHGFIKRLNKIAQKNHSMLTGDREEFELNYLSSIESDNYDDVKEIEKHMLNVLKKSRNIEIKRSVTLKGPQRDDYEIYINKMNIKSFGSQGQKRTAILSIKLSELEIIKEESGEYPVLLLDDVMSELDYKRREVLFESVGHIQTFITCTEKENLNKKEFKDILYVNVKNGNTIRE